MNSNFHFPECIVTNWVCGSETEFSENEGKYPNMKLKFLLVTTIMNQQSFRTIVPVNFHKKHIYTEF